MVLHTPPPPAPAHVRAHPPAQKPPPSTCDPNYPVYIFVNNIVESTTSPTAKATLYQDPSHVNLCVSNDTITSDGTLVFSGYTSKNGVDIYFYLQSPNMTMSDSAVHPKSTDSEFGAPTIYDDGHNSGTIALVHYTDTPEQTGKNIHPFSISFLDSTQNYTAFTIDPKIQNQPPVKGTLGGLLEMLRHWWLAVLAVFATLGLLTFSLLRRGR